MQYIVPAGVVCIVILIVLFSTIKTQRPLIGQDQRLMFELPDTWKGRTCTKVTEWPEKTFFFFCYLTYVTNT